MWYLDKIPKVLHLYWGGNSLSFLRYLTVYSFRKYNPEWKIKIHIPIEIYEGKTWRTNEHKNFVQTGKNYFDDLKNLDIEIVKHNFEDYRFKNQVSETYKADFIRWKILSDEGGVWSDFDIIYTKPIESMPENVMENNLVDTGICIYGNRLTAIGFIFGSQNNEFWKYISELCFSRFDPTNYQSIGSNLLNFKFNSTLKIKNTFENLIPIYINVNTVYLIDISKINDFYLIDRTDIFDHNDAIGFHWYAGHNLAQQCESSMSEDNFGTFKNTMGSLVREVYQ